jgi:hypothetical protein
VEEYPWGRFCFSSRIRTATGGRCRSRPQRRDRTPDPGRVLNGGIAAARTRPSADYSPGRTGRSPSVWAGALRPEAKAAVLARTLR